MEGVDRGRSGICPRIFTIRPSKVVGHPWDRKAAPYTSLRNPTNRVRRPAQAGTDLPSREAGPHGLSWATHKASGAYPEAPEARLRVPDIRGGEGYDSACLAASRAPTWTQGHMKKRTKGMTEIKAVEMTRRIREEHFKQLQGKSPEEKISFFRAKADRVHDLMDQARPESGEASR